jgi:hypothetical protein
MARAAAPRFCTEEDGGLSVEFVILFPFLMFFYLAMFVFWDVFQTQCVTIRATETIADMMSRETGGFDEDYVDGMHEVFDWLTTSRSPTGIRMTVAATTLDEEGAESLEVLWSHASGGNVPVMGIEELDAAIPTPALGEQLIVLETFYAHVPLFDVILPAHEFHHVVATRPRYVPQVMWAGL